MPTPQRENQPFNDNTPFFSDEDVAFTPWETHDDRFPLPEDFDLTLPIEQLCEMMEYIQADARQWRQEQYGFESLRGRFVVPRNRRRLILDNGDSQDNG